MDFRSISKSASTRLAIPSTNMTPQLEDYDLLRNFRDYQMCMTAEDEPFHLVFNLTCVQDKELSLTFPENNVLQVQVVHTRKDMGGVPFARDCIYKFVLPNDVTKTPLTALRTQDDYLVVVESSNIVDSTEDERNPDEAAVKPEEPKKSKNPVKLLEPRKVPLMLKPNLNSTILRQSMEHAELGLFYAKRIVQNCSFVCPNAKEVDEKETVIKGTGTKVVMNAKQRFDQIIVDAFYSVSTVKTVNLPKTIKDETGTFVKPFPVV